MKKGGQISKRQTNGIKGEEKKGRVSERNKER